MKDIVSILLELINRTIAPLLDELSSPLEMKRRLEDTEESVELDFLIEMHTDSPNHNFVWSRKKGDLKTLIEEARKSFAEKTKKANSFIRIEVHIIVGDMMLLVPAKTLEDITGIRTGFESVNRAHITTWEEHEKKLKEKETKTS